MKKHITIAILLGFLSLLTVASFGQTNGDLILQYKGGSGASPQFLTPSGTALLGFNGANPNRLTLLSNTSLGRALLDASNEAAARALLELTKGPSPGNVPYFASGQQLVSGILGNNGGAISPISIGTGLSFDGFTLSANGSAITSLNASNITTGSLSLDRIAQGGATTGQAAVWNGTQWAPGTVSAPVTSVAGRTGTITLSTSDISGLGTIATQASDSLSLTQSATLTRTALGTTPTDGLIVTNTTAAASGLQQISPRITRIGQGWKTTSTAASQSVAISDYVLPVQGTTSPTGRLKIAASINGGAEQTMVQFDTRGFIVTSETNSDASTPNIRGDAAGSYGLSLSNGQVYFRSYNTNCFGVYNGGIQLPGSIAFNTTALGGAFGLVLSRDATGNLQLGDDAASPTTQIVSGADATGTNGTGGDLVDQPGNGTGSGKSGKWAVETAPPGTSGSTPTTMTRRMEIDEQGVIKVNNATTVPAVNPTGGGYLYIESGALKYRGSSGTVTTIANP